MWGEIKQTYQHTYIRTHNYTLPVLLPAVDCGTLTDPANGQVSHTTGTTFGQTATYSCDLGYNLVGDNNRTCQATGRWSGNTLTCQGKLLIKLECCVLHVFTYL